MGPEQTGIPDWTAFSEHYGIRAAYLDEDGGMVAVGHHDSVG